MEYKLLDLNLFDWLLIAIVVYSTVTAFLRGIVLELFALAGLAAGILIAGWNYQRFSAVLQPLLQPVFHLTASTSNIISFLIIVFGTMLAAALVAKLIRRTAHTIGLGFFDRVLRGLWTGTGLPPGHGAAHGCGGPFSRNRPGLQILVSHPISLRGFMRYPSLYRTS